MNVSKKCLVIGLALLLCLGCCSCSSNQASKVDALIESIGEVTAASEETITNAREAYDKLKDSSKELVKNYDVLINAEADFAVIKCKDLFKGFDFTGGVEVLQANSDILTDEEKLDCMLTYGQWYCFYLGESNLKSRLKNPFSYRCLGGTSMASENTIYPKEYNEYYASISIDYVASNSFGGEVRNTFSDLYFFTPDIVNYSIKNIMTNLEMAEKKVQLDNMKKS